MQDICRVKWGNDGIWWVTRRRYLGEGEAEKRDQPTKDQVPEIILLDLDKYNKGRWLSVTVRIKGTLTQGHRMDLVGIGIGTWIRDIWGFSWVEHRVGLTGSEKFDLLRVFSDFWNFSLILKVTGSSLRGIFVDVYWKYYLIRGGGGRIKSR